MPNLPRDRPALVLDVVNQTIGSCQVVGSFYIVPKAGHFGSINI